MQNSRFVRRSSERNTDMRERKFKSSKLCLKCAVFVLMFPRQIVCDGIFGKKLSHLDGAGRESESRPSWPLCKRILPSLNLSFEVVPCEKMKVEFNVELKSESCTSAFC